MGTLQHALALVLNPLADLSPSINPRTANDMLSERITSYHSTKCRLDSNLCTQGTL
jgi:hypothetical protein